MFTYNLRNYSWGKLEDLLTTMEEFMSHLSNRCITKHYSRECTLAALLPTVQCDFRAGGEDTFTEDIPAQKESPYQHFFFFYIVILFNIILINKVKFLCS